MIIKIILENFEFNFSLDTFNLIKSRDDSIEFVDESDDIERIKIIKEGEDSFIFQFLNQKSEVDSFSLQKAFDEYILRLLEHKEIPIKGLRVKGVDGKKFFATASIFVKREIWGTLPNTLEFIKESPEVARIHSWNAMTNSKILNSIATNNILFFMGEDKKLYSLKLHKDLLRLSTASIETHPLCDYFTSHTQHNILMDLTRSNDPIMVIERIINDIKRGKSFKLEEMEFFSKLTTQIPDFNNSIDSKLNFIREFVFNKLYSKKIGMGNYLEYKKYILPVRDPKNSLRNFTKK